MPAHAYTCIFPFESGTENDVYFSAALDLASDNESMQ